MKIFDAPETIALFQKFGLERKTIAQCAEHLGCSKATGIYSSQRYPRCARCISSGKEQAKNWRGGELPATHSAGISGTSSTICPTCGNDSRNVAGGKPPTSITIDTATLADARSKLEKLFDKYATEQNIAADAEKSDGF
ncbi:MAG: hypothetical protein U5K75_01560 [Ahrensia sp.]|nr:hypothetical protein [Ahrensia sp.]